jgi:hypothetical protein
MLVRATLILIALFVGGWMVFEGTHVLIYGRIQESESGLRFCDLASRQAAIRFSSASICIHQPHRSITHHAEEFETLIREPVATRDSDELLDQGHPNSSSSALDR